MTLIIYILGQSSQLMGYGTKLGSIAEGSLLYSCLCSNYCQDIEQTQAGNLTNTINSGNGYSIATIVIIAVQNHLAERHWVEVNTRVNFPIKRAVISMQQNSLIDTDCPVTKYCLLYGQQIVSNWYTKKFKRGTITEY